MTEQRPDERVEAEREWIESIRGRLERKGGKWANQQAMDLYCVLSVLDATLARAERAEAVAESAWKFIVVDGDPQADGGEYWDAYNALWNALVEYRHGHRRKNALTAPGHDEEGSDETPPDPA